MAKDLNELKWIEDFLPLGYRRKPMFGGFGYYLDDMMILAIFEGQSDDRTYKEKSFPFALWLGCMFPAEKENHPAILERFHFLIQHPVLPKWFYLPLETENFESLAEDVLKELKKKSPLFGVVPQRKKKKSPQKKAKENDDWKKIDTRSPRMFGDAPAGESLKAAKRIADLKNLGIVAEKAMIKAGIKTVDQFIKLGWKKTLEKLVHSNPKNRHSIFTYSLIGALENKQWNAISEEQKKEARTFTNSLKQKSKGKTWKQNSKSSTR